MHIVSSSASSHAAPGSLAIDASHLHFAFVRGTDVLDDVTVAVPDGATCALVGPNGAGKSTLLEILAGLRTPRSGSLRVQGALLTGAPSRRPTGVALVSARALPPAGFTVAGLLRYLAPWHLRWDMALADALLEQFAMAGRQRIATLSFGGHMKVQLLCALASRPRVLLLDEPFIGLDVATKDALIRGLLAIDDDEARTTLIASHDLAEMELLVDHLLVLDGGRVRLAGDLDALRSHAPSAATLRDLYVRHTSNSPTRMEPAA